MIVSTRVETVGNYVQLICKADGLPTPKIFWSVLDDLDETLDYSIEKFPFIWVLFDLILIVYYD